MEYTEITLMLVFFLIYSLALLALCFLVASLMSSGQKAGIVIIVLLVAAWLPPQWAQILPNVGYTGGILIFARICSVLHCAIAAQIGVAYMTEWEKNEIGALWSNIGDSPMASDQYGGVLEALLTMVGQIFVYFLLSWYFDYTAPSKYGIKLPWYFPFTKSFWFGHTAKNEAFGNAYENPKPADIEPLLDEKPAGIQIKGLTKIYGDNTALNNLTVTLYKNEITALLGHNGAGKSTTMNMLTGMIMPSQGTALIDGRDITSDMKTIRQKLGFCPQYDIVYPELSVQDHIKFFGKLKNIPKEEYEAYSDELFKQMKMDHALKTPAMALSGGMRRKLSITIAFLGNPSTVILDEPTSAIDPFSRRAIWDVVLSYRDKSTCIISTHYMQEADVLGDRIAIVNHGELKCFGTTMYLKAKYGKGFFLKLAHQSAIDYDAISSDLKQFIPVTMIGSTKTETTLSVPIESARSEQMIEAFEYLEQEGREKGVVSFGISESTMEQVFFSVAADGEEEDLEGDEQQKQLAFQVGYENVNGFGLLALQFWATWVKRFHLTKRSIIGIVFQILMPLLFTVMLLLLIKTIASSGRSGERMQMQPWQTEGEKLFFYNGPKNGSFIWNWLNYGTDVVCMNGDPVASKSCNMQKLDSVLPADTSDSVTTKTCSCSKCDADIVLAANKLALLNDDQLLNLNGRNVTDYIIKRKPKNLIGGFVLDEIKAVDVKAVVNNLPTYISKEVLPLIVSPMINYSLTCESSTIRVDTIKIQSDEEARQLNSSYMISLIKDYVASLTSISTDMHYVIAGSANMERQRGKVQ